MTRQVLQSPLFESQKKQLLNKEIARLDEEIRMILGDVAVGAAKRGDLAGVYVHKFKMENRFFLSAYEYTEKEIVLLAMGPHEHFYRDLKRYLKNDVLMQSG